MELVDLIFIAIGLVLEYTDDIGPYLIYIIIIVVIYGIWRKIRAMKQEKERKNQLTFNEFDDIEKIEQKDLEREQLENEWQKIEESYAVKYSILDSDIAEKDMKSIKIMDALKVDEEEIKDGSAISAILKEENKFDVDLFKKWCVNIFEYMQLGQEKELEQIKSSLEEDLYNRKINQLKNFKKDHLELRREDIVIEEIKILDYAKWSDKEEIQVFIETKMKEYIINKDTNKILRGNNEKINEKSFIMTFRKKDGEKQVGFVRNCQNCGAAIEDTEFDRCSYCGSLVNPIRYNWKLIKFNVV